VLDAKIELPDWFAKALLNRLDRLIELLEYHVGPTTPPPPPGPGLPADQRYFSVDDRTLWLQEQAEERFLRRHGRQADWPDIQKEIADMHERGIV
jgi:hypothetical protein